MCPPFGPPVGIQVREIQLGGIKVITIAKALHCLRFPIITFFDVSYSLAFQKRFTSFRVLRLYLWHFLEKLYGRTNGGRTGGAKDERTDGSQEIKYLVKKQFYKALVHAFTARR